MPSIASNPPAAGGSATMLDANIERQLVSNSRGYANTPTPASSIVTANGSGAETAKSLLPAKKTGAKLGSEAKPVPNPAGSRGKPDHQALVKKLAEKAQGEAKPGESVVTEKKIRGHNSNRRPDVQIVDDKTDKARKILEA